MLSSSEFWGRLGYEEAPLLPLRPFRPESKHNWNVGADGLVRDTVDYKKIINRGHP